MKTHFLIFVTALPFIFSCQSSDLALVKNGTSNYRIVVPVGADSLEIKAAGELQKYFYTMTGVQLPLVKENDIPPTHRVFIGGTVAGEHLDPHQNEIVIAARDNDLFIVGSDSRSTLYAVYTFLEDQLGCRFYTPQAEVIPKAPVISVARQIDYRYTPPVTTRTVHSQLYYDHHDFADKRKTTYEAFPGYVPGAGVHTFHRFVPASEYLIAHPEYFALRNGRRIPTQLCLTNQDVLRLVIEKVGDLLKQYPDRDVISVSQDDNTQYCQCDGCMAVNDREGSPSGSVIEFVNKVAREFPDKTISTLAYQYTRTAPLKIKPEENVLITLCSIECDRSAPIDQNCIDFADDLVAWGKLTDNIRIWDYTTQFTNYLAPFPNIYTLQPNIRLFRDNNAKWIFEQHSNQPSELFELRSYLTAKLLWNPEIDRDSVMVDFLNGYYEEAAPFIQNYITTIHEEVQKDKDFVLYLYGDPSQGFRSFLRPGLLKQYDQWYNEAAEAVKGKPAVLKRVNSARISIDYAILEAARQNDPGSFAMVSVADNGTKKVNEKLVQRLQRFESTCKIDDITYMNEMRYSVREYLEGYEHTLLRAIEENIALGKPVILIQQPKKYANEDPQTLTDGAFGGANFYANWLGFEGNDLEAVIDLEAESTIKSLSCDFLQVVNHIVFFPTNVKYYYSVDGKKYTYLGNVNNKRPLSKESKINDIQSYRLNFPLVKARYVKVVADNMGAAPDWHHGAGLPGWIFVDELMIK